MRRTTGKSPRAERSPARRRAFGQALQVVAFHCNPIHPIFGRAAPFQVGFTCPNIPCQLLGAPVSYFGILRLGEFFQRVDETQESIAA